MNEAEKLAGLSGFDPRPNHTLCPEAIKETIMRYLTQGVPPGDFMQAVLSNNLRESIGRADFFNLGALPHIVAYLHSCVPRVAWGSPETVHAVIGAGGLAPYLVSLHGVQTPEET